MAKRTIIEIAERVGVSPATVSRALNNVPGVSADKREQIIAVAAELDYHPNAIARSLQGKRASTLAFMADVSARPASELFFFKDFVTALAARCAARDLDLLLHPVAESDGNMNNVARLLRSGRADGVILADIRRADARVDYLLDLELPFVAFGRTQGQRRYAWVDVDGDHGIYTATAHLLAQGHRRIGFLGLALDYGCAVDRYTGYRRALTEHDLPFDEQLVALATGEPMQAVPAMDALLDLADVPTAFVAASDMLALYAVGSAARRGLVAGRDFAITGFDDLPLAAHSSPPLTTLRQPLPAVCDALIERLLCQIRGDEMPESVLFQPELIVRESSTGTPSAVNERSTLSEE